MKIHYIQHAPFEKLGVIETWAIENHYSLSGTQTYADEKLPDASTFDFLIVMGGPQSPLETEQYPYLRDEITLIEQAIKQNKRVLGICLGAQLIAEALGAKTQRSPHKEIGVYPIELLDSAKTDPIFSHLPKKLDVMHWHNDMPGIPNNAVLLAKSEGCPQQAFRYGDRVYGFQFHVEMTKELIEGMIQHCPDDLKPGAYIRTAAELLSSDFEKINATMLFALDQIAKLKS
jgi:GMP synthase (glutamine-hydrolysing)